MCIRPGHWHWTGRKLILFIFRPASAGLWVTFRHAADAGLKIGRLYQSGSTGFAGQFIFCYFRPESAAHQQHILFMIRPASAGFTDHF